MLNKMLYFNFKKLKLIFKIIIKLFSVSKPIKKG